MVSPVSRERIGRIMSPFVSDEELRQRAGEEAVAYVRELRTQVETQKARADAAVINAEQTCTLIEQKFLTLNTQFSQLEHEKEQSITILERRSGELAEARGQAHRLELEAIQHQGDLERVSFELAEVRKSNRDLLDLLEQKNTELDEKNISIKSYLDKIVSLTDERSSLEAKLRTNDAELVRSHAIQGRLQQEKELLDQHNSWLNEELNGKLQLLMGERRASAELEASMQSKLVQAEKLSKGASEELQRSKERLGELESKFAQTREELKFAKQEAALQEDHLSAEVATATKLADLYKQSSEEWSNKSNELEGVIKALETHLNQVESEHRDKLDREIQARETAVKELGELKEKLDKVLADRNSNAEREAGILELPDSTKSNVAEPMDRQLWLELHGDGAIVPSVSIGISGTALAAALLRDGWSLAKMYAKYQEAVDAWRHERHERKHSQTLLDRVLHEIELKAGVILDERVEHQRMIEAYYKMEEKLRCSMTDQSSLENSIRDLKAELRKREREMKGSQKEISDLQIQVAGLLKECADVKQRYEAGDLNQNGNALANYASSEPDSSAADLVISEKLVTFKDIKGMVEQNSQLRVVVRDLAQEIEQKESEMKELYATELERRAEVAAQKVAETLQQYKEKEEIIETLQGTVAMYKRLYEEELKSRYASHGQLTLGVDSGSPDVCGQDYSRLLRASQEEISTLRVETTKHIQTLEDELAGAKTLLTNARIEQARIDEREALAREQMVSLTNEAENRRKEMDAILKCNMEFSQTITNYQQQLRENSQKLQAAEELANKLRIEASVLEKEKVLLASAEKRASAEVSLLSDRAHRLQASLDTFQSVEEARESARAAELKKLQDDCSHMQKEWTEARKELEVERRHSRDLTVSRDKAVQEAMDRVDAVSKELGDALKAMSAAETRAQVAESRCTELEASLKKADDKISLALTGGRRADNLSTSDMDAEILANLQDAREELEHTKEDLTASRAHTEQYKGIAEANEDALKQLEAAHNSYKTHVDHMKEVMETDTKKLRERLAVLESENLKKDAANIANAEEWTLALNKSQREIADLQKSLSASQVSLEEAEVRIKSLKEEVDKYHLQWRDSQRNYERQILLQAETIRELTLASDRIAKLEQEESALRIQAETAETQLASLQVSWAMEKSSLESLKIDAEKKWKDVEEQNRLLLDRLEAVHITAAEHSFKASGEKGSSETSDDKGETDLQNVIRYLRRSKEMAETEVSLLKQERLRLQKQLDAALCAAEDAQTSLRHEQENSRASLYSHEEFKSLQAQVREINLMRESNAQLREENRRNFEDSREAREKVQQAHAELEPIQQRLKEKEAEVEAAGKELEMQRAEVQRWQNRVSQLLAKYKAIDVEDYQRVKIDLAASQEHVKVIDEERETAKREAEALKKELEGLQEKLDQLQSDISEKENRFSEQENKLQNTVQAEATTKGELERFKRHVAFLKRKLENVTKEKEDMSKENESLSKQMEEFKANAGKRITLEARQDAARQEASLRQEAAARVEQAQKEAESILREREARIQILEKTLERERESVRKERLMRQRDQKTFYDVAQKAVQEKKRFLDEFENFKREKPVQTEKQGSGAAIPEPTVRPEIEERATSYLSAVNVLSEVADGVSEAMAQQNPSGPAASASVPSSSLNPSDLTLSTTVDGSPVAGEASAGSLASTSSTVVVPHTGAVASASSTMAGSTPVSSSATAVARPLIKPSSSNAPSTATRPPFRPPSAPMPVPDQREREMAQLRAQIQEKEKSQAQASVTQARKTARRLIRPRIEPEVVTELGDSTTEGTSDMADVDMEAEEPKLSAGTSEAVEVALISGAVPEVTMVATQATESSVNLGISTASGVRKRPALSPEVNMTDDVVVDMNVSSENPPPQKRPRAVEMSPEGNSEESALVPSTALDGIAQTDQLGQEVAATEFSPVPTTIDESVSCISISESERERPAAGIADIPPQKRSRFVRLLLAAEAQGATQDDDLDRKKIMSKTEDVSHETDVVKELKVEAEVVAQDKTSLEFPTNDQKVDDIEPRSTVEATHGVEFHTGSDLQSTMVNLEEELLSAAGGTVTSTDGVNVSEVGGNEVVVETGIFEEGARPVLGQAAFSTDGTDLVVDVPMSDGGIPRASDSFAEGPGAEELQEVEEEAEEGEIAVDPGVREIILFSEPDKEEIMVALDEGKGGETRGESFSPDQNPVPLSEHNDGDVSAADSQEDGGQGTRAIPSDVKTGISESGGGPSAIGSPEQKPLEEQRAAIEEQPSEMILQQGSKSTTGTTNTTIHLAERARERGALRRGGVNSPPPTARGGRGRTTRGSKRAPTSSRGGRVISTGVRGRGQAGGTAVSPDVARGAQQGGPGATGQTDSVDTTQVPNPYETLTREGEN